MSIQLEVWGDYACFTRPELKVERVSYDVMTPSAARGLLESIFWHPGLQWHIRKIYVLNPIRFISIVRNEVKSKVPNYDTSKLNNHSPILLDTTTDIQQRSSLVLRDVHYVIDAYFSMTDKATPEDNPGKFCEMMHNRAVKGQCYHQPYLGLREFPAAFRVWDGGHIKTAYMSESRDLGIMLYDMDYHDLQHIRPLFFRAVLKNGVLHVPSPGSLEVMR